jgi:hypothetical protein
MPDWTPVDKYPGLIMERSEQRGWGFTQDDFHKLAIELNGNDHAGLFMPTGIDIWLGNDLIFNWKEAINWLKDSLRGIGYELQLYVKDNRIFFLSGSEKSGEKKLKMVNLDFAKFQAKKFKEGLTSSDVVSKKLIWPGLEVVWLLALNPHICLEIGEEKFPGLLLPGLVTYEYSFPGDQLCIPFFGINKRDYPAKKEIYIDRIWNQGWLDPWMSIAAFKE